MPLLDIQTANAEVGRVRIGIKKTNTAGTATYPSKLDTFRLTTSNRAILDECARNFGGEVRPWPEHKGQFELVTERKQIKVLLSGSASLSQDYEKWLGGGWSHRCDGLSCLRRDKTGQEWSEACSCAPIRENWAEHRKAYDIALTEWEQAGKPHGKGPKLPDVCKPTSRLNFMLTEINVTGMWLFTSGGKIFASEIAGHFATCEALGLPNYLFCILTLDEEEIKKPGRPAEKFPVVRVSLDPEPPNFMGRIKELIRSSQYELPAPTSAPALQAPAHSLPAPTEKKKSNADLAAAHGLDPDQYKEILALHKAKGGTQKVSEFLSETYTGGQIGYSALIEILKPQTETPPADEAPDPFADDPVDAYLINLCQVVTIVAEFKSDNEQWQEIATKAREKGINDYDSLIDFAATWQAGESEGTQEQLL